jgi:hypothetical protein
LQVVPDTHAVGPVHPTPPHCPYSGAVPPEEEVVEVVDVFALVVEDFADVVEVVGGTLPPVVSPTGVVSVASATLP